MSDSIPKICEFCQKRFDSSGRSGYKKRFCDVFCQQNFWKKARNMTGKTRTFVPDAVKNGIRFSDTQLQVIFGGLLGDSSLLANKHGGLGDPCLKMCHAGNQKAYLLWKVGILKEIFLQKSPNTCPSNIGGDDSFHHTSIQLPFFKSIYPLFYRKVQGKSKRLITMKTLNLINTFGLLIWFLDDGYLAKEYVLSTLAVNAYSLSEVTMIKGWLWKKFRIEAKIDQNKIKGSYCIRFNKDPTLKLMSLFAPFYNQVPECMRYKLIKT